MKTTLLRTLFSALLVFVFSCSSRAQSNSPDARLSGSVLDASGAGIAGVQITAHLDDTRNPQKLTATSAADGAYALTLPPGRYHVRFVRPSFVPRDFALDFAAGQSRKLDLRLDLEPLSSSVVVTAQAEPALAQETSASVTVITREEIDQRRVMSLPDLLLYSPGIAIGRTGAEGGQTSNFLAGGNSSYTKVLVDGTPVNEPGNAVDFSNFSLDNIDKVEIVRGAESALYGTDAVSGVIQLFTHRGTTRTPAVSVYGEGGSFSTGRGGAQISGLRGAFDYSAAASYFQTDGQGPNDHFLNRVLSGNIGWSFSDSNQLRLSLRNTNSDAGIPGQTLLLPPNLDEHNALHFFNASARWNFTTGTRWHHEISGVPKLGVTAGYQYEVENAFLSFLALGHVRRNNQGGFLDFRWLPLPRVVLNFGARAEANDNFGTRVVPRLGASLAVRYGQGLWGDTRVRAFYGQGIKEPRFDQTFGTDPCDPGNPSLRPERSRTWNAGVDQKLASDHVKISGEYFQNRFYDIVSFGIVLRAITRSTTPGFKSPHATDPALIAGNRLIRRPPHSGSLILNASIRRVNVNLAGYFSGARTDSDFLSFVIAGRCFGPCLRRNSGYARFDLASSYDLGRGVSIYTRVANLFDKQYQDAIGYPALGRDVRVGMNYRFSGKN